MSCPSCTRREGEEPLLLFCRQNLSGTTLIILNGLCKGLFDFLIPASDVGVEGLVCSCYAEGVEEPLGHDERLAVEDVESWDSLYQ